MSHPKICPCRNCLSAGKGAGLLVLLVGAAAAAVAVVKLSQLSAWIGRWPFLVAGFALVSVVLGGIGALIRDSVRTGRTVATPTVRQKAHPPRSDEPTQHVADTPTSPTPRLRLVQDNEAA